MKSNRSKQIVRLAASTAAMMMLPNLATAATTGTLVSVSLSGSTAMRSFTTSQGLTFLDPSIGSIQLANGLFTVPNDGSSSVQLAPTIYPATASGEVNGLRVEWHEQGSVEGILEMANDQIAPISGLPDRNPSLSNPVWVNRTSFTFASSLSTSSNLTIGTFGTADGQSAVQMAISDVKAFQGFSYGNAAASSSGNWQKTPQQIGYGKGNAKLQSGALISGLGSTGARQSLQDDTVLNLSAASNGTGAWNTAGVNNLDSETVAVTATLFVANPGTGLTKVNRSDAQWLQTTGRLANGVDFNMTERDPNSGTRNVAALNTGVDPSFAVGEDDGGDGNAATGTTSQIRIGSGIRFSGKTAGGGELRPTVQNARMAIGVLAMSDAIAAAGAGASQAAASSAPLRALQYSDSSDGSTGYVQATADNITLGKYAIWQQEQYVTVKNPGAGSFSGDTATQWANRTDAETGIKGDNADHDVADFRNNIIKSVGNFPQSLTFNDPADQLIQKSFILPQMMFQQKPMDGVGLATDKTSGSMTSSSTYSPTLRNALVNTGTLAANFNTADPNTVFVGTSASTGQTVSTYGNQGGGGALAAGVATITASGSDHSGGNWLVGNFNQNGVRDWSAVKAAAAAQAALFAEYGSFGTDATYGGVGSVSDSATVHGVGSALLSGILTGMTGLDGTAGAKKGDLIVMGDFNSDGKFDGKDLYLMARGAAVTDKLASNATTYNGGTLTATTSTFGDAIRTAQLRKNAALDDLQTNATPQQRIDAAVDGSPTAVANAFNKFDINRDGVVNRSDAQVVDHFVGSNYTNIDDQIGATIATDGTINPAATQRPISLVDVELNDNGTITDITSGPASDGTGSSDFKLIRDALGTQLRDGDANFDGKVDTSDFATMAGDFGLSGQKWSTGDFNFDGVVNALDFNAIAANYGQLPSGGAVLGALVPEPASATVLVFAACGLAARRRRSRGQR